MKDFGWIKKSIALGTIFFLAILLVKPVGVSTQFSLLSGIFHSALDENVISENSDRKNGYESSNAYYDKSDASLAKSIKNPWNYGFVFVLSIPLGAYISYSLNDKKRSKMNNLGEVKTNNYTNFIKTYLPSFLGGLILLYSARMADGCTSGHMMSCIMQGSVSGYVFAISAFSSAIPIALWIGKKAERNN